MENSSKRKGALLAIRKLLLVFGLFIVFPAFAKDPLSLSLKESIALALCDGTTAKLAALQVEEAKTEEWNAAANLLPQAGGQFSGANQIVNLKAYGFSQPGSPSLVGPFNVYDAHVDAALKLIDVSALARYRAARQNAKASRATDETIQNNTAAAVATLYIAELRATSRIQETESTLRLFEKVKALTEHQLSSGLATILDVHRAKFKRSTQEQVLLSAKEEEHTTRLAFLHAIGTTFDEELVLRDSLEDKSYSLPSLKDALAKASETRPEVHEANEHLAAAKTQVMAEKAQHLPSVEAQFRGGYNGDDFDALSWNRSFGGTVSVPLFTSGRLHAEVRKAALAEKRAEIEKQETARQIEEQVRNAYLHYTTSQSHLKAAHDNFALAEEELRIAMDRFKNGLANSLDVDNAQTALTTAIDTKLATLASKESAWIELLRATGEIRELITPPPNVGFAHNPQGVITP